MSFAKPSSACSSLVLTVHLSTRAKRTGKTPQPNPRLIPVLCTLSLSLSLYQDLRMIVLLGALQIASSRNGRNTQPAQIRHVPSLNPAFFVAWPPLTAVGKVGTWLAKYVFHYYYARYVERRRAAVNIFFWGRLLATSPGLP